MFERLEARAVRAAEARASARREALADELRAIMPRDVSVEMSEDGVIIAGPGVGRQLVLDASLRWTIAGLLK